MAYSALVLRVMIASPSDTIEARDAVEQAIQSWNDASSDERGVILRPWRWETSAVPLLGSHPQALINSQGVDRSDIVFALFGSRLGSPTTEAVSGTVEEIERALGLQKPVHLYFSKGPLPNDVDPAQLVGLRAFKHEIQKRGLYGEFTNPTELTVQVWKAIELDLRDMKLPKSTDDGAVSDESLEDVLYLGVLSKRNREYWGSTWGRLPEKPRERAVLLVAALLERFEPYAYWPSGFTYSLADTEVIIEGSIDQVSAPILDAIGEVAERLGVNIRVKAKEDGRWLLWSASKTFKRGRWKPPTN